MECPQYDLCETCFPLLQNENNTSPHPHNVDQFICIGKLIFLSTWMPAETVLQTILYAHGKVKKKSYGNCIIRNMFNNYGAFPCLGYDVGFQGDINYKWLTYAQVKSRFINASNGLRTFLSPVCI